MDKKKRIINERYDTTTQTSTDVALNSTQCFYKHLFDVFKMYKQEQATYPSYLNNDENNDVDIEFDDNVKVHIHW